MIDTPRFKSQLRLHEDERFRPYKCTAGKTTIGVGRNLDDVGISKEESDFLLSNDIARVERELDKAMPWWRQMTEVRQRVLADMCFNLGLDRLSGFVNTLAAMRRGDYDAAAEGMLASKWATQVGGRAKRLAAMMKTGKDYTA